MIKALLHGHNIRHFGQLRAQKRALEQQSLAGLDHDTQSLLLNVIQFVDNNCREDDKLMASFPWVEFDETMHEQHQKGDVNHMPHNDASAHCFWDSHPSALHIRDYDSASVTKLLDLCQQDNLKHTASTVPLRCGPPQGRPSKL